MTSGFKFGPWLCKWSEAFYLSDLSLAMVNHKPIVPAELQPDELADMWKVAQLVSKSLEKHFNADSLTFAIQDGRSAGQTVPHVHIHILPRREGDFRVNDLVYAAIEKADVSRAPQVDADAQQSLRSPQQMAEEALVLRSLFTDSLAIPSD